MNGMLHAINSYFKFTKRHYSDLSKKATTLAGLEAAALRSLAALAVLATTTTPCPVEPSTY
jgi:hypothetical protein